MNRRCVVAASILVMALAGCSHHAKQSAGPQPSSGTPGASPSANLPSAAPIGTPSAGAPASTGPSSASTAKATPTPTTAPACNGGRLTFGKITKPYVLTRVTPPFTVTGGSFTPPAYTAVTTVNAGVLGGPQVPKLTVYRAFAAKAGFDPDVKLFGQVYDGADLPTPATTLAAGKYVMYRSVHAVSATFTYKCGSGSGEPYDGFATSALSESAGVVNCAKPVPAGSHDDVKAARATCAKSHS
jgi:hypothetical protein